jgi:CubicO group peptidase (beta-lactamase class C family)
MRRSLFGVGLGTLLVLGLVAGEGLSEPNSVAESPGVNYQPAPVSRPPTSNLITHVLSAEGGPQTVVVVDPSQRVLAVYHVDKTTGEIALRSVRNITWDLEMVEFNSGKPLPQDIRNLRGELQR